MTVPLIPILRRSRRTLLAFVAALGACGSEPTAPDLVAKIAGEYELIQAGGMNLPAQTWPGRVTVFSGHLSLLANQQFTKSSRAETCSPIDGSCSTHEGSESGVWVILYDGSLYLDSPTHQSWPAPRITADGRTVSVWIGGDGGVGELYVRK